MNRTVFPWRYGLFPIDLGAVRDRCGGAGQQNGVYPGVYQGVYIPVYTLDGYCTPDRTLRKACRKHGDLEEKLRKVEKVSERCQKVSEKWKK